MIRPSIRQSDYRALADFRHEIRRAFLKPLSAIGIGTGGPFGAEGPIIQTGGALGSLIGQILNTTAAERKAMLACGGAAGLAATFNHHHRCTARCGIASLRISYARDRKHDVRWNTPIAFRHRPDVPYRRHRLVGFSRGLKKLEEFFDYMKKIPSFLHPAVGALGLGVVGYFYETDVLKSVRVSEIRRPDVASILPEMTVAELAEKIAKSAPGFNATQGIPIVTAENKLVGIVTHKDLLRALEKDPSGKATVFDADGRPLIVAYPDELGHDALLRILQHDVGRLPVVSREDSTRLVGYLNPSSFLSAWKKQIDEEHVREEGCLNPYFRFRDNVRQRPRADQQRKKSRIGPVSRLPESRPLRRRALCGQANRSSERTKAGRKKPPGSIVL
jgi:CBS domain-containing protein